MIATHHAKQSPRIGKLTFFDVFNPRPVNSDGNLMLGFARYSAGVATDTFAVVYDETKIHNFILPTKNTKYTKETFPIFVYFVCFVGWIIY